MQEICLSGSMRGVWKWSYGCATQAPPDERGGNGYAQPNATALHSYSTLCCRSRRQAFIEDRGGGRRGWRDSGLASGRGEIGASDPKPSSET